MGARRSGPLLAGLLLLAAAPAVAQETCPWCHDDPELMAAAGLVSHGGFEFGTTDTEAVDRLMATSDILWLESEHFELGFALGPHKVRQEEKKKVRAELTRLAEVLPDVKPRTKVLDPWLRTHLYAQRLEDLYTRFQELMQVTDEDFPAAGTRWNRRGKYMGEGPYLGQKAKYEVLILPSEAALVTYLKEQFGLLIKMSQRWNVIDRGALTLTIHTQQGNLKNDEALHGHLAFNQTINLLDGYKHYSYDTPIWIREGLGHFVEREINPRFNTFDSSEGAVADMTRKEKWAPEAKKLVTQKKAPRMAELVNLKAYAELTLDHHFTTWSMVSFLIETDPDGFACLNDALHGAVNARGVPDGSNLDDLHRQAFKDCLGMGYAQFDLAWAEWVQNGS